MRHSGYSIAIMSLVLSAWGCDSGGSTADASGASGSDADGSVTAPGDDAATTGNGADASNTQADGGPGGPGGHDASTGPDEDDLLKGKDGIAATVDGTVYAFTAGVTFGVLPGAMTGQMAAFKATDDTGGFDPITRWDIRSFPPEVGKHACKDGGAEILLTLAGIANSTASSGGGSCMIEVTSVSALTIEGRFTATLVNPATGKPFDSTTDGVFRLGAAGMGGETLPAGKEGASFTLDGTTYLYDAADSLSFETFAGIVASPSGPSPGSPLGVQFHTLPNELGTFHCGDGESYRNVNVIFFWNFKYYVAGARQSATPDGPPGSKCTITLTKVGTLDAGGAYSGTLEGSFDGTFVNDDGSEEKLTVTDGLFRLVEP